MYRALQFADRLYLPVSCAAECVSRSKRRNDQSFDGLPHTEIMLRAETALRTRAIAAIVTGPNATLGVTGDRFSRPKLALTPSTLTRYSARNRPTKSAFLLVLNLEPGVL